MKNLILTLMLSLTIPGLHAQLFNATNADGETTLTIVPERGHIFLNYLVAESDEATFFNNHIGLIGSVSGPEYNYGVVGIAPTASNMDFSNAIYSLGDTYISGNLYISSDWHLKKDFRTMGSTLEKINKIEPMWYTFAHPELGAYLPKGQQTGFLAQEVENVFPHLVKTQAAPSIGEDNKFTEGHTEYQSVNYIGMIPILWKGIQEQQEIIADYEDKQAALEIRIERLEALLLQGQPAQKVDNNTTASDIRLEQNQPNPFSEFTTISYFVPKSHSTATMIIFDAAGNLLQEHNLNIGSEYSLEISLADYPSGMYYYAVKSGNVITNKKMILKK